MNETFRPSSKTTFDLFVFHRNVEEDGPCLQGGARGIVIDFEQQGKNHRQQGYDTQINAHSMDDLRQVKSALGAYVICRVEAFEAGTGRSERQIRDALDAGADEILVPMIRRLDEVEAVLQIADAAGRMGILIETEEATRLTSELRGLPLTRVYIGLNDLRIARKSPSIFSAISDHTVESLRRQLGKIAFGFAGLTVLGGGSPFPVEHLINEMARLECDFTFLRRSFFRDTRDRDPRQEIPRILAAVERARQRSVETVERDQAQCWRTLENIIGAAG